MPMIDVPARLLSFAEELLDNDYARKNLREGAGSLRDALRRAQKRRAGPTRDGKLRHQLEAALATLHEGAAALASGRQAPKRTGRKAALGLLSAVGVGGAAALVLNKDFRESVFGSAKALGEEIASGSNEGSSL